MTPYSNIFSRFSLSVQDPDIDKLKLISLELYENYLTGLLQKAIIRFRRCKTILTRDDILKQFENTLTEYDEEVIANLMVMVWFEREVNRLNDIRLALGDTDFKRYAEAPNLIAKNNRLNDIKRDVDALLVAYGYDTGKISELG